MADIANTFYSFDEDGVLRLQKDLNFMLTHLDERNVKRLYTEYCNIQSEDGETEIDGPLLIMRSEGSTTIRLKAGWDEASSEFVFNLYSADGSPTIELDSTGDAVFRGSLNTAEDVYVGNRIFLGWNGSTAVPLAALSTRGMYVMEPDSTKYIAAIYSTNVAVSTDPQLYEFEIESSAAFNFTAANRMRIFMFADYADLGYCNTCDYMVLFSFNDRMFVQAPVTSTSIGTMIGNEYKQVYLGSWDDWFKRVTVIEDQEISYADQFKYFYVHNQLSFPHPTTSWIHGVNTHSFVSQLYGSIYSVDTIMYCSTSNASWVDICTTAFTPINMTAYPDGTAVTSDDYLVFICYIRSTSVFYSTNKLLTCLGQSSSVNYNYYWTAADAIYGSISTGMNIFKKKVFNPSGVEGVTNPLAISYIRYVSYHGINSSGTTNGIGINYLGIHRYDPTALSGKYWSDLQRNYNSTHETFIESPFYAAAIISKTTDDIVNLNIIPDKNTYSNDDMYLKKVQNFDFQVDQFITSTYSVGASLCCNTIQGEICLALSSGVLRLFGSKDGSTFGDYANMLVIPINSNITMRLTKNDNVFKGAAWEIGNPENYREVMNYSGPSTKHDFVQLYIGNSDFFYPTHITNIRIKQYNELEGYVKQL